jgi:hypothetical protein
MSSQSEFRKHLLKKFNFKQGFVINSNNFADVSEWSLSFSLFEKGECINKNFFNFSSKRYDVLENKTHSEIKTVYNLDGLESDSNRIRINSKLKIVDSPQMTSSLKISPERGSGRVFENSLGYYVNSGNNVGNNRTDVYLLSSPASRGKGYGVIKENFLPVITNFCARKIIKSFWLNDNDEYMTPNESHPLWQQFQNDSLVYSLFNTSSNQSSLRQIKYKEKLWDIKNEFFWMSKEQMMELSEKKYFDDIYRDARSSDERYVYTLLHKEGLYEKLSPDAKLVLDMATELVKKTFDMREILHNEHPEYHLQTWDAGWYQIKLILKQFYADDLKDFTKKYKEFEDRMRPLVYELGFLRK